jgi:uncharacterized HAD superfamily protein
MSKEVLVYKEDLFVNARQIVLACQAIRESEKIGYDLDQMIAESRIPIIKEIKKKRGILYDWRTWGWHTTQKVLEEDFGLSKKEALKENLFLWENEKLLLKSPIIKPIKEFIGKMKLLDKEQYIVTSRKPHLHESTHQWLRNKAFFDLIPPENVFLNQDISLKGSVYKAKMCVSLGIKLFFEDCLEQVERIIETSPDIKVIWIPAGEDIFLAKPKSERVIKIPSLQLPNLLVAQSY